MTTDLSRTAKPRAPRPSGPSGCHVVQFYRDDRELVELATGYLADGIRDGEVVVVTATASHRQAFDTALTARGIDVAAARTSGSYVLLDAEDTMRRFLVADWPDPVAFETTMGTLFRVALHAGRPVRAYGDMVALLWDAGHINAALELEALWNSLASQLSFSLFCAVDDKSVAGEAHRDAAAKLCRLHSAVLGRPAVASAAHAEPDGWITII